MKKKQQQKLLATLLFTAIFVSCSTSDSDLPRAATVKVVNQISVDESLIVKIGDNPINYESTEAKVGFEEYENFTIPEGVNKQVEVVAESDIEAPVFSEVLNLKGIHSLYVFEASGGGTESLLIEDNVKRFTDSIVGIRFLNLSKEPSGPIHIKDQQTGTTIASGLTYQSATAYIEFPAQAADGGYTFEFEDSQGNVRITTLTIDPLDEDDVSVKKNFTIVITEVESFSPVIGTFYQYKLNRINNY